MKRVFENFDLENFWNDSDYFTSPDTVTDRSIRNAEIQLGFKLPESFILLIRTKNGGSPKNTCFPTMFQHHGQMIILRLVE